MPVLYYEIIRELKRTVISNSQVENSGYGLILAEPVEKGQLIGLYIGEVITDLEQEVRAILDRSDDFYAFEIVDKAKLIDAKYYLFNNLYCLIGILEIRLASLTIVN